MTLGGMERSEYSWMACMSETPRTARWRRSSACFFVTKMVRPVWTERRLRFFAFGLPDHIARRAGSISASPVASLDAARSRRGAVIPCRGSPAGALRFGLSAR